MQKAGLLMGGAAIVLGVFVGHASFGADVGIYAPATDGGKVVGGRAIRNTLAEADIAVEDFARMSIGGLLKYRVVVIPNTRLLARNEDPRWRDNLRAYVAECGGAIVFCHDTVGAQRSAFGHVPLFPEIVVPGSVERGAATEVRVAVRDAPNAGYDPLPGYEAGGTVAHMYDDHFMFQQAGGKPLLADIETEKSVVAVGTVGHGRVVFNGMYGGHPRVNVAAYLAGLDRDVMIHTVKWCLSGKGPVVTDPAKAEVAEWRPELPGSSGSRNRVAVIGNSGYDIRHRAGTKIQWAGLEYDFIPLHFLNIRGLSAEDYGLIVLFPPTPWEEKNLPDAAFGKIKDYLASGGKAIIFLPMSIGPRTEKHFLESFGVKVSAGPVRDNPGRLYSVVWHDSEGNALQIKEMPGNWFTAITDPTTDNARTIGHWLDDEGEKRSAAIIETPFGYFTTINRFGDHRLFTASAAVELLPELGPGVFKHLLKTYESMVAQVGEARMSSQGQALRARGAELRQAAEAAAKDSHFTAAIRLILRGEEALVKAYAVSMPSPENELRMVCIHIRGLPDPEKTCARLAGAGFTGITLMHTEGHYPSKILAYEDESDRSDWLKRWIDAAHKHALKVGPTFPTFRVYRGSEVYDRSIDEDWRVVTGGMYGKKVPPIQKRHRLGADICRSRPEMVDYAVRKSLEVIERYPVDHVCYDYIRWSDTCYCDYCRDKFQADTGKKVETWPDDAMGRYRDEYNDWRAGAVTRVIRGTAENIARVKPEVKLGVFTFRGKKSSWQKAQYWWEWGDYVDFIMPMFYTPDNPGLEDLCKEVNGLIPAGSKARLTACLAPPGAKGGSDLTRLQQIDLQRKYAPAGIMIFWYHGLTDDYLELLKVGPFRNR